MPLAAAIALGAPALGACGGGGSDTNPAAPAGTGGLGGAAGGSGGSGAAFGGTGGGGAVGGGTGGGGAAGGAAGGVQPYANNTAYWEYRGAPITLLGGLWTHQGFLQPLSNGPSGHSVTETLDALQLAGGNFMRCNLAIYQQSGLTDRYPFVGAPATATTAGTFDLMTHTSGPDSFWGLLATYLTEMASRHMIAQIDIWDPHYMVWHDNASSARQNTPWRPRNTITYTQTTSGLFNDYPDASGDNPFYDLTMQPLVAAQEAFVGKVLEVVEPFDNVILQIENEAFGSDEWVKHWADYIHAHSDKYVIELTDNENLETARARRSINMKDGEEWVFDGGDVSQNGRSGSTIHDPDTFYDRLTGFCDAMQNSGNIRPVNAVKTYTRTSEANGIEAQYLNFTSGVAAVGQHRGPNDLGDYSSPTTGLGGTVTGNRAVTVMRGVDSLISRSEMAALTIPASGNSNGNWSSRDPDSAFAIAGGGKIVVYLSGESTDSSVNVIADAIVEDDIAIQWIDGDGSTGDVDQTTYVSKSGDFVSVARPSNNRWFAVLAAQ